MTPIDVTPIETTELQATAQLDEARTTINVSFRGNADARAIAPVDAFLVSVHEAAARLGVQEVVVDFHAFDFMNSSCFKAFVTWIGRIEELAPPRQYKIRFLQDSGKHWQRRSLDALRSFAAELVSIQ
jgi:hypothetical protein